MDEKTLAQEIPHRKPLVPSLATAVATTRGRRETNQDRVCALRTLVGGTPAVLLAVADGIGGLPAGEQAAELALQVVGHYAHYVIPEVGGGDSAVRASLGDLVRAAGRRIWLWARDQHLAGGAGSTLVCALVWDHRYVVAHAGDSRCYILDGGGVRVLTRDHADSTRLTNALGWPTDLVVDLVPPDGPVGTLDGDCVVFVSSDGLHSVVGEDEFSAAFRGARGVDEACRRLVARAVDRGSTDNVSIAAVEVGHLPRSA
jgi:protein phosphatase